MRTASGTLPRNRGMMRLTDKRDLSSRCYVCEGEGLSIAESSSRRHFESQDTGTVAESAGYISNDLRAWALK